MPSLNPISYVVLGILATRGPSTSYEMKKLVGTSISFFWNFPHAQLYREPQRLAQLGFVDEEQADTGRRQRTFTINSRGRAALDAWLSDPDSSDLEIRDPALLKLFFGRISTTQDIVALAEAQVTAHQAAKVTYERLLDRHGTRPELAFQLAPLRIGVVYEQAYIDVWIRVSQNPDNPLAS